MLERSWQYRENKLHNLKFFSFEFPCNVIKSLCLVWVFSDKNSEEFCGILQATILEWVAIPFSRRSSQPKDWTQVSHIASGFFISWATREVTVTWDDMWFCLCFLLSQPGHLTGCGGKKKKLAILMVGSFISPKSFSDLSVTLMRFQSP